MTKSNIADKVSIEFSLVDLPLLFKALRIAHNTAIMSGDTAKVAGGRYKILLETISELTPKIMKVFPPYYWPHIYTELLKGHKPNLKISHDWREKNIKIHLTIGEDTWESHRQFLDLHEAKKAKSDILDLLSMLEPLE